MLLATTAAAAVSLACLSVIAARTTSRPAHGRTAALVSMYETASICFAKRSKSGVSTIRGRSFFVPTTRRCFDAVSRPAATRSQYTEQAVSIPPESDRSTTRTHTSVCAIRDWSSGRICLRQALAAFTRRCFSFSMAAIDAEVIGFEKTLLSLPGPPAPGLRTDWAARADEMLAVAVAAPGERVSPTTELRA